MITYFISAVAFILMVQFVLYLTNRRQLTIIRSRLKELKPTHEPTPQERELIRPLIQRIMGPLAEKLTTLMSKLTPLRLRESIQMKLLRAGRPGNMAFGDFMALKVIASLTLGVSFLLLAPALGISTSLGTPGFLFFLAGFFVPDLLLQNRIKRRQEEITKSLPYVIDLLATAVEAGLGFQTAISKVVEKARGPLITEFSRALREIQVGRSIEEALRNMERRVGSSDLRTFITTVVQAEELGVSMANVLVIQAQELRDNRRRRAQEAALKTPVRMTFPLVLLILPALMVVILGPALIYLLDIFKTIR